MTSKSTNQLTPAVATIGGSWVALFFICWALNVLDWRLGRLVTFVIAAGAAFIAVRRVPKLAGLSVVAVAVACTLVGAGFVTFAVAKIPPGYYRLRSEFHHIQNPRGWTSRNETTSGNSICFDVCKQIDHELVPNVTDPTAAAQAMTQALNEQGYRFVSTDEYGASTFRKNEFEVTYIYDDGKPTNSVDTPQPPSWRLRIEAA